MLDVNFCMRKLLNPSNFTNIKAYRKYLVRWDINEIVRNYGTIIEIAIHTLKVDYVKCLIEHPNITNVTKHRCVASLNILPVCDEYIENWLKINMVILNKFIYSVDDRVMEDFFTNITTYKDKTNINELINVQEIADLLKKLYKFKRIIQNNLNT